MRVCVDVQPAVAQRAGIGRYARNLVRHLAPQAGADRLSAAYFDFRRRGDAFGLPGVEERRVRWCPGALAQQAWKRLGFPDARLFFGPADVYHFTNFTIPPLRRGRAIVTLHDVSFLRFPEFTEERNLRYLRARIQPTVERADAILSISHTAAREVESFFPAARGKVYATPLAADDGLAAVAAAAPPAAPPAGLDRPYLLTVGTVEPRKNLAFLLEVFERLTAFDGLLVIAGMPGWKSEPFFERLRASPAAARVRYLRYVPDADLPALYAGAAAFLCASHYEGFGLPPLEAMTCGTPVVSSTGGALHEVVGGAACTPGAFDADAWAAAVTRVLSDSAYRAALTRAGRERAAAFSWTDTAQRTWAVYRKVAP